LLIGQKKLLDHLRSLIEHTGMPALLILTGPKGQGKYTLAKEVAALFDADVYEPEALKVDDIRALIEDTFTVNRRKIYILRDAHEMTVQAQNALLKTAEEPPVNCTIIMTVSLVTKILPTIYSRSVQLSLDLYSKEELKQFTDNEVLLTVCSNPGQIKEFLEIDFVAMFDNCLKILKSVGKVTHANTFNILKFVDVEKLHLFMLVLKHIYAAQLPLVDKSKAPFLAKSIEILHRYSALLTNKSINKNHALEMMFIDLKEAEYIGI